MLGVEINNYYQALSEGPFGPYGASSIWGPQIVFDLTLDIYGISGFVVATLLKEVRNAQVFLTLPVSVSEAERTFSLQKRGKNYLRSTMKQDRLNGIATLSINCDMARKLDFSTNIHDFASKSKEDF